MYASVRMRLNCPFFWGSHYLKLSLMFYMCIRPSSPFHRQEHPSHDKTDNGNKHPKTNFPNTGLSRQPDLDAMGATTWKIALTSLLNTESVNPLTEIAIRRLEYVSDRKLLFGSEHGERSNGPDGGCSDSTKPPWRKT